jgi:hypothetical protein
MMSTTRFALPQLMQSTRCSTSIELIDETALNHNASLPVDGFPIYKKLMRKPNSKMPAAKSPAES